MRDLVPHIPPWALANGAIPAALNAMNPPSIQPKQLLVALEGMRRRRHTSPGASNRQPALTGHQHAGRLPAFRGFRLVLDKTNNDGDSKCHILANALTPCGVPE